MSEEIETTEDNNEEQVEKASDLGLTGKEVEQYMLDMAQRRAEDPAEMAATAFAMYSPMYKGIAPKLSKRSLRRILDYLILYPLEKDNVRAANEAEKSVMQIANFLIEAKFIMQMSMYNDNLEKLVEAAESELTEEQIKEFSGEAETEERENSNG
jgi:hypothetical protein